MDKSFEFDPATKLVLIVDDNQAGLTLLGSLLKKNNYRFIEAHNGRECLEICQKQLPDIVLLDIMMPEIDGIETCKQLRTGYTKFELPIILVTAMSESSDVIKGFKAGANDYITKPIDTHVLLTRLEHQLTLCHSVRASNQKVALETVQTFIKGLAHNLNEMVGSAIGAAELLERPNQTVEARKKCKEVILKNLQRASNLTQRLQTSYVNPSNGYSSAKEVIQGILDTSNPVSDSLIGTDIEVVTKLAENLSTINADASTLSTVLSHILQNAIEASQHAGKIEIQADNCRNKKALKIVIIDHGEGMNIDALNHSFEPFYSTKANDPKSGARTSAKGLGLWNAYSLTKAIGGSIKIESKEGAGTKVTLEIPTVETNSA